MYLIAMYIISRERGTERRETEGAAMTTTATVAMNPQVIGQAENAHRAMLERILSVTGGTYHEWVGLTLTASAGGPVARAEVVARMVGALKATPADASATLDALAEEGLVSAAPEVALTDAGRARFTATREAVGAAMGRAYADIPAEELAVAGRVLALVTARINAELAA
jgi:DNA-binding MarR family transcriptional regulator